MSKRKRKKEQKEQFETFQAEFNNIIDAIAERLLTPIADLPVGLIIEYEINNLRPLAHALSQKLPVIPRIVLKRVRIPERHILLWHGTSLGRAYSILERGFGNNKRGVFFSTNIMTGYSYAEGRASNEHSEPAIFAAHYDLSRLEYNKQFRAQDHVVETHCIFRAGVASRIVRYLLTCHGLYSTGKVATETRKFRDDLTTIAITQSSGNAGIAYWLNSFLDLDDSELISENHPVVGQIKAWVEAQYARDRTLPIADEEILNLVNELLTEYPYNQEI